MCSDQLLALDIHNNFNLKNKIIVEIIVLQISIFLDKKHLHHHILLHIWRRISQVISYGCLYSSLGWWHGEQNTLVDTCDARRLFILLISLRFLFGSHYLG